MPEPLCDKLKQIAAACEAQAATARGVNEFVFAWQSGAAFAYRDAIYYLKTMHPQLPPDDQCQPHCSTNTDSAASDKPQ